MFARINIRTEEDISSIPIEELKEYSVIIAGFKRFSEVSSYDSSNGVPTIIANTYARYGTIFTFLGPEYKFTEKLMVNKEPMLKPTEFNDSDWISSFFEKILSFNLLEKDELNNGRTFRRFNFPIVYAVLCQYLHDTTGDSYESIKSSIQTKFKESNRQSLVIDNSEFDEALSILEKAQELKEFHPTNSVIGSIIAQETQKIVIRADRPFYGLFTYDIKTQIGKECAPTFMQEPF